MYWVLYLVSWVLNIIFQYYLKIKKIPNSKSQIPNWKKWAVMDSNQWPLPCQGSTLTNWANRPNLFGTDKIPILDIFYNGSFYLRRNYFRPFPKRFHIFKKALIINANPFFYLFKFLNPPVINCRKKFRVLAKSKNFLSEPTISAFLTVGELKFLPPIRMNFRQFITSGRFFFASRMLYKLMFWI